MDDIFVEKEEKRGKGGPNKKEDKKEDFLKSIFKKRGKRRKRRNRGRPVSARAVRVCVIKCIYAFITSNGITYVNKR